MFKNNDLAAQPRTVRTLPHKCKPKEPNKIKHLAGDFSKRYQTVMRPPVGTVLPARRSPSLFQMLRSPHPPHAAHQVCLRQ